MVVWDEAGDRPQLGGDLAGLVDGSAWRRSSHRRFRGVDPRVVRAAQRAKDEAETRTRWCRGIPAGSPTPTSEL